MHGEGQIGSLKRTTEFVHREPTERIPHQRPYIINCFSSSTGLWFWRGKREEGSGAGGWRWMWRRDRTKKRRRG
ncbi:unnamed protein product [Pleuronectes platessa]|uniref:Uncharacterized protein n=1 Tax=Pleuronectes platessa TaxID=8262 RepID=A0A9N7VBZ0_PLEPL|nr:unnamed protein product [Pleuronectes platessa]